MVRVLKNTNGCLEYLSKICNGDRDNEWRVQSEAVPLFIVQGVAKATKKKEGIMGRQHGVNTIWGGRQPSRPKNLPLMWCR